MLKIVFLSLSLFLIIGTELTACKRNDRQQRHLVLYHRLFSRFIDEAKLQSYLSSFGQSVSASQQHKIYKRAPARIKKLKLNENKSKSVNNAHIKNSKNATITPRHIIKFEIEDAKYNEEYEQMKKSRKLRVKRAANNNSSSNSSFREPKEILKFSIADAVISASTVPETTSNKNHKKDNKAKREIKSENLDSETDSSKSIKITHPLSSNRKNRYVTFDELPSKLQKNIESAVMDAQKKVPDGDYLKFYYGDRIIKIPQSMWKYISSKSKTEIKQPNKFLVEHEEKKNEYSEIFGQKTYYSTTYKPATTTIVEKAKSYVNFVTPKDNILYKKLEEEEESEVLAPKKSFYFYAPQSTSTPVISSFKNTPIRETIPISEEIDEHHAYVPLYQTIEQKPTVKSLPIPTPTSYVEFNDHKYTNTHEHEHKNYEFGYHVSDFKSGNNFGHTQSKKQNVINGQYSILLPDGRIQITKYIADDSGFHADITYQNIH